METFEEALGRTNGNMKNVTVNNFNTPEEIQSLVDTLRDPRCKVVKCLTFRNVTFTKEVFEALHDVEKLSLSINADCVDWVLACGIKDLDIHDVTYTNDTFERFCSGATFVEKLSVRVPTKCWKAIKNLILGGTLRDFCIKDNMIGSICLIDVFNDLRSNVTTLRIKNMSESYTRSLFNFLWDDNCRVTRLELNNMLVKESFARYLHKAPTILHLQLTNCMMDDHLWIHLDKVMTVKYLYIKDRFAKQEEDLIQILINPDCHFLEVNLDLRICSEQLAEAQKTLFKMQRSKMMTNLAAPRSIARMEQSLLSSLPTELTAALANMLYGQDGNVRLL